MKLNLYIISEHLKEFKLKKSINSNKTKALIENIGLYDPSLLLKPETLYIIDHKEYAKLSQTTNELAFVCIGNAQPLKNCDTIFLDGKINPLLIFNEIQSIFTFYNNWEIEMYSLLSKRASLKELVECCLPLTDNPFCLVSSTLQMITYAENKHSRKPFFSEDESNGSFLREAEINAFRNDASFLEGLSATQPRSITNDFLDCTYFYNNIFVSSHLIGRIVIFDVVRPITEGDYILIITMSEFFGIALENQNLTSISHPAFVDAVLEQLLERKPISPADLEQVLSSLNWSIDDSFLCCLLESESDIKARTLPSFCSLLEGKIPESVAFIYRSHVLLILDLSRAKTDKMTIRKELSDFAKDKIIKVGLSNTFSKFNLLRIYYTQAYEALGIGQSIDQKKWCYDFDEYALAIFTRKLCTGKQIDSICPTALHTLIEYDTNHKRNYTLVLKTYLENHLSVAKTTKSLFMHRATLLYQLDRIKEISGLDLDDYDTQLHLMIYFKALDLND